tara:strand:+ start:50759 stop:51154 length:396 start_codon:yes stop_codon:yes gene_type:complete
MSSDDEVQRRAKEMARDQFTEHRLTSLEQEVSQHSEVLMHGNGQPSMRQRMSAVESKLRGQKDDLATLEDIRGCLRRIDSRLKIQEAHTADSQDTKSQVRSWLIDKGLMLLLLAAVILISDNADKFLGAIK